MRAYLVPIGRFNAAERLGHVAFMQRKDHLLAGDFCDKLGAIGGKVESGETPLQAALRELSEEVPRWWQDTTGSEAPDDTTVERIYHDPELTVFALTFAANRETSRKYIRATEEGVPALLTRAAMEALPHDRWVFPQMKGPLVAHLEQLDG